MGDHARRSQSIQPCEGTRQSARRISSNVAGLIRKASNPARCILCQLGLSSATVSATSRTPSHSGSARRAPLLRHRWRAGRCWRSRCRVPCARPRSVRRGRRGSCAHRVRMNAAASPAYRPGSGVFDDENARHRSLRLDPRRLLQRVSDAERCTESGMTGDAYKTFALPRASPNRSARACAAYRGEPYRPRGSRMTAGTRPVDAMWRCGPRS